MSKKVARMADFKVSPPPVCM